MMRALLLQVLVLSTVAALAMACAAPRTTDEVPEPALVEPPPGIDPRPGAPLVAEPRPVEVATVGRTRAIVFYVRFRDDLSTSDCSRGLQEWPVSSLKPRIAESLLSTSPEPPFPDSSLTAFFHRQSLGRYTIYGDAFGYVTREDEAAYRLRQSQNLDRPKLTQELLEHFDPLIDFSQYDENGDGFVDHIFVVIRNFNELVVVGNRWISGVAALGLRIRPTPDFVDGMAIDPTRSGSFNRYQPVDPMRDNVLLLAHEFGHDLFNGNQYFGNHLDPIEGNMVPHDPPPGRDHEYADRMTGYALMQGAGRATQRVWGLHLTAAERSYVNADGDDETLRWIECAQPVHGQSYLVRDLYDFGDCVRLTFEDDPTITELFVQHIDNRSFFNQPRLNPAVIDAPCPGCRTVEGGTPVNGLLIELSRRNAQLPFRARRSVIPPDNALRRQSGCDLAVDVGPRLRETYGSDFWRPDNGRQLSPWTRPNVFGYTFATDVPAHYFETGWHVLDDIRYDSTADPDRAALAFDYYSSPFGLETFVIRQDSWMGPESDGLVFEGHVRVGEGATLTIEAGVDVTFAGGLSAAPGARIIRP